MNCKKVKTQREKSGWLAGIGWVKITFTCNFFKHKLNKQGFGMQPKPIAKVMETLDFIETIGFYWANDILNCTPALVLVMGALEEI